MSGQKTREEMTSKVRRDAEIKLVFSCGEKTHRQKNTVSYKKKAARPADEHVVNRTSEKFKVKI